MALPDCLISHSTTRQLAIKEAKCWRAVTHEHVLPLWGIIKWCNEMYLVSPFVHRGSLLAYIESDERADRILMVSPSSTLVQRFLTGLQLQHAAAGLTFVHSKRLIHGDMKADNILISDSGVAMICDFGLSRPTVEETQTALHGTGTMRFMSPELLHHESKTFFSDVWAYGMTIYQVCWQLRLCDYSTNQCLRPLAVAYPIINILVLCLS